MARGGYLFCEDWIVKELLEKAYPKYVAAGTKMRGQWKAEVFPARGQATHAYLRAAGDGPTAIWKPVEPRKANPKIPWTSTSFARFMPPG